MWLDSYVTDFLTRARERGFAVPDIGFKLALDRLRNFVGNAEDPAKDGGRNLAYALYVLARNGAAPVGDLRYFADTKLDAIATPIAKAQIAAALGDARRPCPRRAGLRGGASRRSRRGPCSTMAAATMARCCATQPLWSRLRPRAARRVRPSPVRVERVEAARGLTPYTSTQENAWMVLAARALAKDAQAVSLDVGGEKLQGALNRTLRASDLSSPLKVTNIGEGDRASRGHGIGGAARPRARCGERLQDRAQILHARRQARRSEPRRSRTIASPWCSGSPSRSHSSARVIVADYLPAGFEIDNPRLVSSGDSGALSWIEDAQEPVNAEFRDDRFSAAFERKSGDASVFTVAYVVRAVSPGRYVQPQAYVEDMYRPDRFGRTATGTIEVTAAK